MNSDGQVYFGSPDEVPEKDVIRLRLAEDEQHYREAAEAVARQIEALEGVRNAERIARAFHDTYERLAPAYGYETREASRTHWSLVPAENKKLMIAVAQTLLDEEVISA